MENTNQISIADLDTIKNIIDLARSRGAFRGEELQEIGAVYNKLKNFLDAVIANAKVQQPFADSESEQPQGE
jgi:Mg2+ and Co2+ transporter CorA